MPAGMQRDAGWLEVIPRHHGEKRESSTKIVSFLSEFDKQACFGEVLSDAACLKKNFKRIRISVCGSNRGENHILYITLKILLDMRDFQGNI